MLTAHTAHFLHPEYLQPLTSAPVSIELDAKKSPLALLAQTCSQIGKADPPSSKLGSVSSGSQGDKEPNGRSAASGLKLGEHRPGLDDKSSFKPYNKVGGDCRRDGLARNGSGGSGEKAAFRVPSHNGNPANGQQAFSPHPASPNSASGGAVPPGHALQPPQLHKHSQSPGGQHASHSHSTNGDAGREQGSPHSAGSASNNGCQPKKDSEENKPRLDSPHLANSSLVRASANSSNGSSESGSNHEGSKCDSQSSQSGLAPGHVAPVSPYKTSQSLFPLPSAGMGYHGSVVGAYAGYPSQFVPGLEQSKSSLGMGIPGGKHPSSSPLTGASPPSLMQGLCRDPYCLSYPNVPHLGGSNCSSCLHDPASGLKSSFPLVYPSHPLHPLHTSSLSSSVTSSFSHPLYTYGFVLQNDPMPHACNWVSAGGPCDKRFPTSDELLAHLRTHTALSGAMDAGKLMSACPGGISSSGPNPCHLHLPHQSGPASMPGSFSLRPPPGLGLGRYHPYGKVHLPPGQASMPLPSMPATAPYYPTYALYSQRLGSASALGYP